MELSKPIEFEVVPLRKGALEGAPMAEVTSFWRQYEEAVRMHSAVQMNLGNAIKKVNRMKEVLHKSTTPAGDFDNRLSHILKNYIEEDKILYQNHMQTIPPEY